MRAWKKLPDSLQTYEEDS